MIESLSQSELSTLMASEKRGLAARAWNQRPPDVCVSITWLRFPFYFAFGKTAMEYIQQISWALELQLENQWPFKKPRE